MKQNGRKRNNRIWILFGAVVAVILSLYGIRNGFASVLALEQEARCGAQEHVHTAQCYEGGERICSLTEHTHSDNCYLVLLEDNDINHVLSQVDRDPENNLENVIHSVVGTALTYNSDFTPVKGESSSYAQNLSSQGSGSDVSTVDIAALNDTITENDIQPSLVLNEDLYTSGSQTQTGLLGTQDTGNTGTSTLALGDQAQTGNNNANFYVYLDNGWQSVGTLTFSITNSEPYTARLAASSVTELYNNVLGSNYTVNDINLIYATSANANGQSWYGVDIGTQYAVMGDDYSSRRLARAAKYVRLVNADGDPEAYYTVRLTDIDGNTTTKYVRSGDTVTLPEGYNWLDESGNTYAGGQSAQIYATKTFTAQLADGKFRIIYNMDFPTISGITVSTKPTLAGTAVQSITDVVEELSSALIRNVSQHEVIGKVDGHSAKMSRVIRFRGWRVGDTDTILSANSTLTWEELLAYAPGKQLKLTAVWDQREVQTASFYVRYDSVAVDTGGNQTSGVVTDYTPELFATHVGGEDARTLNYSALNNKYYIADTSSDNSYGADQAIRALYGEQEGIWLQSFPEDDYIFELLKQYADDLEVDGERVNVNDLNDNVYTIRWYVFKCQSDAWHIDGRLVKKEGIMQVTKTFAGNKDAVAKAKEDFYITAINESGTKSHTLRLDDENVVYNADTDTYKWEITGVTYGEKWTIREYTYAELTGDNGVKYDSYNAYRVVDIFNTQNKSGEGMTVDVTGMTYATDAGAVEVLRTEFTNVYHTDDSLIIKKEDSKTGAAIGGASFQLLQNGQPLHFTYNSEKDQYIYDPFGSITQLTGSQSGYYEIMTTGFSYDDGDITVQEVQAPTGYVPIENIVVGYTGDPDKPVDILNSSPMASYHAGLLIVQNTTESTSVTVVKQWLCPQIEWKPVTMQLLANGNIVSALIPGVEATVTLDQAAVENNVSYTWDNLPSYANGEEIVWSVREIQVGTEKCKNDYTFANWLVSHGETVKTTDSQGKVINTKVTLQNDTRRTLLRLIKTSSGGLRLSGATFTLEYLLPDGSGGYTVDPDFVKRTQTTNHEGALTFDNLLYGYYRLTETQAPAGYQEIDEPAYLTIREDGTVEVDGHSQVTAGSTAYTVQVYNHALTPLPSTGGSGPGIFATVGAALMLFAVCGYILPRYRKKGGYGAEN